MEEFLNSHSHCTPDPSMVMENHMTVDRWGAFRWFRGLSAVFGLEALKFLVRKKASFSFGQTVTWISLAALKTALVLITRWKCFIMPCLKC